MQKIIENIHQSLKSGARETYVINRAEFLQSLAGFIRKHVPALGKTAAQPGAHFLNWLDDIIQNLPGLPVFPETRALPEIYPAFFRQINNLLNTLPETVEFTQTEERFSAGEGDRLFIRFGKMLKRWTRGIGRLPVRSANVFRRIFKKQPNAFPEWKQTVQFRELAQYLFETDIIPRLNDRLKNDLALRREIVLELDRILDDFHELSHGKEMTELYTATIKRMKRLQKTIEQASRNSVKDIESAADEFINKLHGKSKLAGTIEFPHRLYSGKVFCKIRKKHEMQTRSLLSDWNRDFYAFKDRARIKIEALLLNDAVERRYAKFDENFNLFFEGELQGALIKALDTLKKATDLLAGAPKTAQDIEPLIRETQSDLKAAFGLDLCAVLKKTADENRGEALVDDLISGILLQVENLSSELQIIEKQDSVPIDETEKIQWQAHIESFILKSCIEKIQPLKNEIRDFLRSLYLSGLEIDQILEVNLTTALFSLEETEAPETQALDAALQGSERALGKHSELIAAITSKKEALIQRISETVHSTLQSLLDLVFRDEVLKLKWKERQYQIRSAASGWRLYIIGSIQQISQKTALYKRWVNRILRRTYARFQSLMGKQPEVESRFEFREFPTDPAKMLGPLPLVYQRLFQFDPLEDERFLVGRNIQLEKIKTIISEWEKGSYANSALVGEQGSGKTTLFHFIRKNVIGKRAYIAGCIEQTIHSEEKLVSYLAQLLNLSPLRNNNKTELVSVIQASDKRQIVILEGVQNLYLRHINGFEPLEAFLFILSETSQIILWLVSCSAYSWRYLDKVLSISEYFAYVEYSDQLSPSMIRDVILRRHRVSGYKLHFLSDEEVEKSRNYKKLAGDPAAQQLFLQEHYIKILAGLAGGNAKIAMSFWLNSIAGIGEDTIEIAPLSDTEFSSVADLSSDKLFTLAALILHDDLTVEEHAMILNQSVKASQMMFSRLRDNRLVVRNNGAYKINALLYRQIVQTLKAKNIFH